MRNKKRNKFRNGLRVALLRMHAKGLRDAQIARALKKSRQRIFQLRKLLGLPANKRTAKLEQTNRCRYCSRLIDKPRRKTCDACRKLMAQTRRNKRVSKDRSRLYRRRLCRTCRHQLFIQDFVLGTRQCRDCARLKARLRYRATRLRRQPDQ